jgi:hypothetical protein
MTKWQPGQSGNPGGRPKGSRNKLSEQVISDLFESWTEGGADALRRVRTQAPEVYLRVIAGVLPKELKIDTASDFTDAELDQRIRQLAEVIGVPASDNKRS